MSCISSSKYTGLAGTEERPGWEELAVLAGPGDPRLGITNACAIEGRESSWGGGRGGRWSSRGARSRGCAGGGEGAGARRGQRGLGGRGWPPATGRLGRRGETARRR